MSKVRDFLFIFTELKCQSSRSLYVYGRNDMFYLTTHSAHFIYGYMASDIWSRTIQIAKEETRGLCYTSRGALTETRNSSMGPP